MGNLVLLPTGVKADSASLQFVRSLTVGDLFRAVTPGIVRVHDPNAEWAILVRISRFQYVGLSEFRHLEEEDDDA